MEDRLRDKEIEAFAVHFKTVLHSLVEQAGSLQPEEVRELISGVSRQLSEYVVDAVIGGMERGVSVGWNIAEESKGEPQH